MDSRLCGNDNGVVDIVGGWGYYLAGEEFIFGEENYARDNGGEGNRGCR